MLDKLTIESFTELDDKIFKVQIDKGKTVEMELIKAEDVSGRVAAGDEFRKAFSIVFRGPKDSELAQETYKVHHDKIGSIEILLVPIVSPQGSDEKWYEAVFN